MCCSECVQRGLTLFFVTLGSDAGAMGNGQDLGDYSDGIRDDHHATLVFERQIPARPGEAPR
jgi:hypothetical protein